MSNQSCGVLNLNSFQDIVSHFLIVDENYFKNDMPHNDINLRFMLVTRVVLQFTQNINIKKHALRFVYTLHLATFSNIFIKSQAVFFKKKHRINYIFILKLDQVNWKKSS